MNALQRGGWHAGSHRLTTTTPSTLLLVMLLRDEREPRSRRVVWSSCARSSCVCMVPTASIDSPTGSVCNLDYIPGIGSVALLTSRAVNSVCFANSAHSCPMMLLMRPEFPYRLLTSGGEFEGQDGGAVSHPRLSAYARASLTVVGSFGFVPASSFSSSRDFAIHLQLRPHH